MSIVANKDTYVVIQGGAAGVNAARRMAEFCYLVKRQLNVVAFVYPPDAGKTNEIQYGSGLIQIPIYRTVANATAAHPQINTTLVYIGADRACAAGMEALNDPNIQVVSMITEGVPEKDAKLLGHHARKLGLDIGSEAALQRYQSWRRFDNALFTASFDALNRLFSNDIAPIAAVRRFGLDIVDSIAPLKRFFMRQAGGEGGDAPKLMQGLSI